MRTLRRRVARGFWQRPDPHHVRVYQHWHLDCRELLCIEGEKLATEEITARLIGKRREHSLNATVERVVAWPLKVGRVGPINEHRSVELKRRITAQPRIWLTANVWILHQIIP